MIQICINIRSLLITYEKIVLRIRVEELKCYNFVEKDESKYMNKQV